jgi:hypothetical protein
MVASVTSDLVVLGAVLAVIFLAWLYLKRECEDSPLVGSEIPWDHLSELRVPIVIGLAGVTAERFWGGVEVAALVVASLLTGVLVLILTARHYPYSAVGRSFNWVIGRKPELFSRPSYVLAEMLRAQGRVAEAMAEVDRQLAKAPDDFTGLMLSAELAAVDCKDMALAGRIVNSTVRGRKRSEAEIDLALNRLAEWRVANGSEAEAAAEPLVTFQSQK